MAAKNSPIFIQGSKLRLLIRNGMKRSGGVDSIKPDKEPKKMKPDPTFGGGLEFEIVDGIETIHNAIMIINISTKNLDNSQNEALDKNCLICFPPPPPQAIPLRQSWERQKIEHSNLS